MVDRTIDWQPQLIKKYPDAKFYKYDVDEAGDIAQELGVSQMPTFHIFKDGDVESSITGAKGKSLESAIKDVYGSGTVEDVDTSQE